MLKFLNRDLKELSEKLKALDKKVIIIFISLAILQTISWYVTSRRFFRLTFFETLQFDPNVYLYEYLYWYAGDFLTWFVIPLLIIIFIFKEKPATYGLKTGDYKTGLKYSLIFFLVMLPFIWFASSSLPFIEQYPGLSESKTSWNIFLIYEAGLLLYMIAWEFIWRGYMLFGLQQKFGYYAILFQMLPFVMLHNGKPMAETFGAIVAAIALAVIAIRTGSVFYCVITHYGVMFTIDLLCTLRYRTEDYGTGLSSLIKLIQGS